MESNTTEDGKKVAEFMGIKVVPYTHFTGAEVLAIVPNEGLIDWPTLHVYSPDQSWELLMPVVEKFMMIDPSIFNYDSVGMSGLRHQQEIIQALSICTPIDRLYRYVVNAIKWYNQTQKK